MPRSRNESRGESFEPSKTIDGLFSTTRFLKYKIYKIFVRVTIYRMYNCFARMINIFYMTNRTYIESFSRDEAKEKDASTFSVRFSRERAPSCPPSCLASGGDGKSLRSRGGGCFSEEREADCASYCLAREWMRG